MKKPGGVMGRPHRQRSRYTTTTLFAPISTFTERRESCRRTAAETIRVVGRITRVAVVNDLHTAAIGPSRRPAADDATVELDLVFGNAEHGNAGDTAGHAGPVIVAS